MDCSSKLTIVTEMRLRVEDPHKGCTFNQKAGLDPVGIGGAELAEGALREAEAEDSGDGETTEEDPVVVPSPPDTGDRKL